MNYASTALETGDYVGLTYIAQSLINRWHTFNNESKHDACDKLIQYSLWKGKGFHIYSKVVICIVSN